MSRPRLSLGLQGSTALLAAVAVVALLLITLPRIPYFLSHQRLIRTPHRRRTRVLASPASDQRRLSRKQAPARSQATFLLVNLAILARPISLPNSANYHPNTGHCLHGFCRDTCCRPAMSRTSRAPACRRSPSLDAPTSASRASSYAGSKLARTSSTPGRTRSINFFESGAPASQARAFHSPICPATATPKFRAKFPRNGPASSIRIYSSSHPCPVPGADRRERARAGERSGTPRISHDARPASMRSSLPMRSHARAMSCRARCGEFATDYPGVTVLRFPRNRAGSGELWDRFRARPRSSPASKSASEDVTPRFHPAFLLKSYRSDRCMCRDCSGIALS